MVPACASSLVVFILTWATLQDLSSSLDQQTITCPEFEDQDCGGVLLQCGNLGISSISQIAMSDSTKDVTSLHLDGNVELKKLDRNSFTAFPNLRFLSIANCGLKTVDIGAFWNLSHLHSLDLSNNGPLPMFTHEVIDQDGEGSNTSVRMDSLNIGLPNLTQLSIDVHYTIQLGNQFKYMSSLKILMLFVRNTVRLSSTITISETSFQVLRQLNIVEFHLTGTNDVVTLNKNAFINLTSLNYFKLKSVKAGNVAIMESLHAFRYRNLSYIGIIECHPARNTNIIKKVNDGVVTIEMLRNLNDVCVNTLRWVNSDISAVELNAFWMGKLRDCLKVLDLTGNTIMYGLSSIQWMLPFERSLQEFYLSSDTEEVSEQFARMEVERRKKDRRQYMCKGLSSLSSSELSITEPWYQLVLRSTPQAQPYYNSAPSTREISIHSQIQEGSGTTDTGLKAPKNEQDYMGISIGKLTKLYFRTDHKINGIPPYFRILNNHLREISMLSLPFFDLSNTCLLGLTHLKLFSARESKMLCREDLFDNIPALEQLDLFSTQSSPEFLQRHLKRLLLPVPALRHLDLGQNGLSRLQNDAFQANEGLTTLLLAHNLFKSLPFSISFSPRLTVLDLTYNAFIALDDSERDDLDRHAHSIPTFALRMEGNPFMCTCQSIPFIGWLHSTTIGLDQGGNYSCLTADGQYTYTASLGDLQAMWRLCNGKYFFMITLTCLLVMLVVCLLVYLVTKFKIHIISVIIGALDSNFRRLGRKDFRQDVFIAYADDDYRFVRFILLRYLEECLGVTTFVHQRDMRQDSEALFDAIHESWRTVLVITTNFLDKYQQAHCVMKHASLLVNPKNPNRLVVLVEPGLRHRIPTYVLSSLEDQHIIVLQDLHSELTYDQMESLKHRIMSP